MSLFRKFLKVISSIVPEKGVSLAEADVLSRLNPDKIYVENVRSLLNVSHGSAQRILETGVRQGVFVRRVEVQCPDGSVAASAETEAGLPRMVHCWEEEDGFPKEVEIPVENLAKTTFYRLNDRETSPV